MKKVIKFSGDVENFNSKKIYYTVLEAGGSKKLAIDATREIKKIRKKEITTKEILNTLLKFLKKEPGVAQRYNLKRALMDLGPTGFPFEEYFADILNEYGYKTLVGNIVKGKIIKHEVDIIAKKEKTYMIECKYHNESGTKTKLQPAMYTYARFLDVKKNKFNFGWLITNTKCSIDATNYARGVGLKITAWKYPEKESLQELIEKKKLYPITILKSIDNNIKEKLFKKKIFIANKLMDYSVPKLSNKLQITQKKSKEILNEILDVCY